MALRLRLDRAASLFLSNAEPRPLSCSLQFSGRVFLGSRCSSCLTRRAFDSNRSPQLVPEPQMPKDVKDPSLPVSPRQSPRLEGREQEEGTGKPAQRAPSSFPPSLRPPSSVVGLGVGPTTSYHHRHGPRSQRPSGVCELSLRPQDEGEWLVASLLLSEMGVGVTV